MDNRYARDLIRDKYRREALSGLAAAAALGKRASVADVLKVSSMLSSADPKVRVSTIKNLANLGGKDAVAAISRCLQDKDPTVRTAACEAIGHLRAHSAKTELYDALHDKEALVRCGAATALAMMGDKSGLKEVKRLVCVNGRHQWAALRSLNAITGKDFRINDHGLNEAIRWIRARNRFFKF
ncbi:MAG: HEAT repeat domain-containing protein [Sedimentisphaerales bacterium]|nr:HEAT repeat domain-containing protein [Sedimentisphaerales bacterium]